MGQKVNSTIFNLSLPDSEYNSKYLEKNKEESTLFLYKDLEIKNYINRIFEINGYIVHTLKIEYSTVKIKIFIKLYKQQVSKNKNFPKKTSTKNLIKRVVNKYIINVLNFYLKNTKIEVKIQNLNKKFKNKFLKRKKDIWQYKKTIKDLKRFIRRDINNKNYIKAILIAAYEKNSSKLLAKSIATILEKKNKRQFFFLFLLKTVIENNIKTRYSTVKGVKIVVKGRFNKRPRAKKFLIQTGQISLHSFKSKINYYSDTAFTPYGTFGIKTWVCY